MTDFDKETYWDRRKLGLHGQIHELGSSEQRYDDRIMVKLSIAEKLSQSAKEVRSERKKSKSTQKTNVG